VTPDNAHLFPNREETRMDLAAIIPPLTVAATFTTLAD